MRILFRGRLRLSLRHTCAARMWMPGLAVIVASSLLAGCATTKAAAAVTGPPLAVPDAPERMIVPAEEEPLASTATGLNRPLAAVPQVQPNPPTQRGRSTSAPRVENENRSEAAVQNVAATAVGPSAEPARDPRPVPAAESNYPQRIAALLGKASSDRKCVDYGKLSNERKDIYNESIRHADTAAEKVKERNYLVALAAAEKAAAFAADLATTCPNR